MQKTMFLLAFAVNLFLGIGQTGCVVLEVPADETQNESNQELTSALIVSAAVSLIEPLTAVAQEYEKSTQEKVFLNFSGSNTLARQILLGAPVDLFISADDAQMDRLEQAGLLEVGSRTRLWSNQMVIVVPNSRQTTFLSAHDLVNPSIRRIAIGDPQAVPAGVYARRYLENEGLWKQIKDKIVPMSNVRAVLSTVEAGNADAGVVYRTDTSASSHVTAAFIIPSDDGPLITYPGAVIAHATNAAGAQRFMMYLQSQDVGRVFKEVGFSVAVRVGSGT